MPIISAIVPIYNSEKYLEACIDSILAQTFTDFELILIDDGSTDSSGIICDRYAQKDNRVVVIHKENAGVSAARNDGINLAKGEYITFVDSDDYIDNDMFKIFCTNVNNNDIVICGLNFVFEGYTESYAMRSIGTIDAKEFLTNYFVSGSKNFILSGPVNKLFKTKIIKENKILFKSDITVLEDGLFVVDFFKYAKNVGTVPQCCYQYIQRSNSAVSKYHKSNLNAMSSFYEGIKELINVHSIDTYEINAYIDEFFYARYIDSIRQVCITQEMEDLEKLYVIKQHLSSDLHKRIFFTKCKTSLKKKIRYLILQLCSHKIFINVASWMLLKLFNKRYKNDRR